MSEPPQKLSNKDKSTSREASPRRLSKAQTDADPEKYRIIVGWSTLEQHYVAWIPELPGVACGGDTPEQAIKYLRLVRDSCLKSLKETGKPIPKPKYIRIP